MENRFFRWRGVEANPTQIVPRELLGQLPPTDVRYFVRVLQHLDEKLPGAGLTFFLTWHLDAFHEAMQDAVVILLGDENNQMPSFQAKVRAIFKVAGLRRVPFRETLRLPLSVASGVLLRDARNTVFRIERRVRFRLPRNFVTPAYDIPVGTGALLDVAPPPIEERQVDVFFAGGATSGWVPRARTTARKQMAAAVAASRTALPQCRMELMLWPAASGKGLSPEIYTKTLANAKIALVPRGNYANESYRLLEAAKLGCVIVTETLPPRWYFRDCPAVSIQKWSLLPGVLRNLLWDPSTIAQLSLRSRQWWTSTVSEAAVAKFIAQTIVSLAHPPPVPPKKSPSPEFGSFPSADFPATLPRKPAIR
jgi:hypothetical protein